MFILKRPTPSLKQELYRKAIHLSSLWMPLFIYLAPKAWALFLFGTAFALNVIIEYANYRRQNGLAKLSGACFSALYAPKKLSATASARAVPCMC